MRRGELFSSTPTIEEVLPWVCAYWDMPEHGTGGELHVALDDGNLDDHTLGWTVMNAVRRGDLAAAWIAGAVIQMPWPRRVKLYLAIADVVYSGEYQGKRATMQWPQKWHYGKQLPG